MEFPHALLVHLDLFPFSGTFLFLWDIKSSIARIRGIPEPVKKKVSSGNTRDTQPIKAIVMEISFD